jgi:S1-C subfamily serine protease
MDSDSEGVTRRALLASSAGALAAGLAGCNLAERSRSADPDAESDVPSPQPTRGDDSDQYEQFADGDSDFTSVYRAAIDSVVQIRVYGNRSSGQGTGFVYDRAGHVLTNQHVVEGAGDVYLRFKQSGWKRADVLGTDVYSDLAVLSVESRPESATALTLRQTDPAVGTKVLAIGNPFGLSGSVSHGIVSGVNRTLPAPNNFSIPDAIQTDAPVNPGNSGGPLVTLDGNVAGVINAGGGDNIGFAISSPLVRRVAPELVRTGSYDHSYMGVGIIEVGPLIAEANDLGDARGIYVSDVRPNSPSSGVFQGTDGEVTINGTEVEVGGDVIVAMDGTPIPTNAALSSFLALETRPRDTVDVEVIRDGRRQTVELTLGSRPEP